MVKRKTPSKSKTSAKKAKKGMSAMERAMQVSAKKSTKKSTPKSSGRKSKSPAPRKPSSKKSPAPSKSSSKKAPAPRPSSTKKAAKKSTRKSTPKRSASKVTFTSKTKTPSPRVSRVAAVAEDDSVSVIRLLLLAAVISAFVAFVYVVAAQFFHCHATVEGVIQGYVAKAVAQLDARNVPRIFCKIGSFTKSVGQ